MSRPGYAIGPAEEPEDDPADPFENMSEDEFAKLAAEFVTANLHLYDEMVRQYLAKRDY